MSAHRQEHGFGLVELLIGLGITAIVIPALGLTLVAVIKDTSTANNQMAATEQLRNAFFLLNQDTQSGVASLATVAPADVTISWIDYSTGSTYSSRFRQVGSELQRTLTVNGVPSSRAIATSLVAGGFSATQSGDTITYALTVTNGTSTESQTESTTMRVHDLPPTPFPTVTVAPTATPIATAVATATLTSTFTSTATRTNTPTATATPTNTSTPTTTSTNTAVPTATNTPSPTATPACASGDTGYLSPSANAADTGGNNDGFETNPTGAYASGGTFATNSHGSGDRHRFYNYAVSVPAACNTIQGIVVRADYQLKNTGGGGNTLGIQLSWDGGTTWTAMKTDNSEPTTLTTVLFGSLADTWGRTWAVANLSDANLRVRVTMNTSNGGEDHYLDWIPVRIYYGP